MGKRAPHAPSTAHTGLRALWQRDGHVCWICERVIQRFEDASRDHVHPLGHIEEDELRLAHKLCNSLRGALPVETIEQIKTDYPNASVRELRGRIAAARAEASGEL